MKLVSTDAHGRRGGLLVLAVLVCLLGLVGTAQATTFTVNTTTDPSGAGGCSIGGSCSLRQAIAAAQAAGSGNQVNVPGDAASYVLTQGTSIPISTSLTIQGDGAAGTVVDASKNNNGDTVATARAFTVTGGTVVIALLTVTGALDGNESGGSALNLQGGGVVYDAGGNVTLRDDAFPHDSAPLGGAASLSGGTLTLADSSFTSDGDGYGGTIGGALFVHSGTVNGDALTFENDGPFDIAGGAIYLNGGTTTLTNTTIVGSGASSSDGGGIENAQGTLSLAFDTLSGNVRGSLLTDQGGAVTSVGNTIIGSGFSDSRDFGCVFAGEVSEGPTGTAAAAITHDLGNNIDEDGACNLSLASDHSGVSAHLAPIGDNGGPVRTQALLDGSPAFNNASASACPATDARGTTRPQSGGCDIGAFEAVLHGAPTTATTMAASSITSSSAVLGGTINLDGEAGGAHFLWGTSPAELTNSTGDVAAGIVSANTPATLELDDLTPGTSYYYRVVADNASASKTDSGAPVQFTTLPAPPAVFNAGAQTSTDTTATLDFSVNPNGGDTKYVIKYGTNANDLDQTTGPVDLGSTSVEQDLSVTLAGLTPGSNYSFDVIATNVVGTNDTNGTFITQPQITGTVGHSIELTDEQNFDGDCPTTVTVDWGDGGSPQNVTPTCDPDTGNVAIDETHTYSTAADFHITVDYGEGVIDTFYGLISPSGGPSISDVDIDPTSLTDSGATVDFTINPNGQDTKYRVDYGPSTDLGSETPSVDVGSGTTAQQLNVPLTGLAGQTVYYQLVATSGAVTQRSELLTFTTDVDITGTARTSIPLTDTGAGSFSECPEANISWGDGTTSSNVEAVCNDSTAATVQFDHVYAAAGRYRVSIDYGGGPVTDVQYAVIAPAPKPTVGNLHFTAGSDTEADIAFSINPNGTDTSYVVKYGPGFASTTLPADVGAGTTSQSVDATLSNLTPGTTYQYEVVATNLGGTTASSPASLTTDQRIVGTAGHPIELTDQRPAAGSCPAKASIEWSDTTTDTVSVACTPAAGGQFVASVDATHTYRDANRYAILINYTGLPTVVEYANVAAPTPPTVSNVSSTPSDTSVTVSFTLNPNGTDTQYSVQYGTSASDLDQTTATVDAGAGTSDQPITVTLPGLTPGSQYFYSIFAADSGGSSASSDVTSVITNPPGTVAHQSTTTSSGSSSAAPTLTATSLPATTSTATTTATTSSTSATTTTTGALPPPVEFKSENVAPVSGTVLIALPVGATLSRVHGPLARASVAPPKGRRFIPLTQARQIPVGSILDTTHGTVAVTAASATGGPLSTADFSSGVFTLLQNRAQKGITELDLQDTVNRARACTTVGKARGKQAVAAKKVSNQVLGLLKSTDHGKFSTRGAYGSATVRGTQYSVADTCAGTLTTVTRGSVVVDYFRRHQNVIVGAGHAFLAKANGGKSAVVSIGKRAAKPKGKQK